MNDSVFTEDGIILCLFVSKNSSITIKQVISSFFKYCHNADLIKDLILISDRSSSEEREYFISLIKKYLPDISVTKIYKDDEVKNNHAEICENFRKEIIKRKNKYCFLLEDDFLFDRAFDLLNFKTILDQSEYSQLVLTADFKKIEANKNLNLPISKFEGFVENPKSFYFHILKNINNYLYYTQVYDYNCFSLNPSLTRIDFFKKGGSFNNSPSFELDYNLTNNSNYINLLSEEYFCYHIGHLKNEFSKTRNIKKDMKIGILFASYNCADYIDRCFQPWLNLREELNLVLASTNGRYDLSIKEPDTKGSHSLLKLIGKDLDFLVHSSGKNNRWSEEQSRTYMLNFMNDQKVDLIWCVDADEFYSENDIKKILNYIKDNNQYDAYSVQFKNYVFELPYWIDGFQKDVIYWMNRHSGIKCFNFDNDITYNDNTITQTNNNKATIPKYIAHIDHSTWLNNDSRIPEKIRNQNIKYDGPVGAKCAYLYDETNKLTFNDLFFKSRNLEIPVLRKFGRCKSSGFYLSPSRSENSIFITEVRFDKSFCFKIYSGSELLYQTNIRLIPNVNFYISLFQKFFDLKNITVLVEDLSNSCIIHEESFYF
jgi:hypothetical protein